MVPTETSRHLVIPREPDAPVLALEKLFAQTGTTPADIGTFDWLVPQQVPVSAWS
ncbi:hypothetical protein [Arthrobacter sp. A5]|uniref:hypothetical protein n=1 Tax=Arthrobacter sp. A5 TaxID=576926 RepID=UPI003DA9FF39